MKTLFSLLILLSSLITPILAEDVKDAPECWVNKDVQHPYLGKTLDELTALFGEPFYSMNWNAVNVWTVPGPTLKEHYTLIAAFSVRQEPESPYAYTDYVSDYLLIDENRRVISGTIPETNTIAYLHETLPQYDHDQPYVYDTGSGFYIPCSITCDGYIVLWHEMGEWEVYDCVRQKQDLLRTLRLYLGWV